MSEEKKGIIAIFIPSLILLVLNGLYNITGQGYFSLASLILTPFMPAIYFICSFDKILSTGVSRKKLVFFAIFSNVLNILLLVWAGLYSSDIGFCTYPIFAVSVILTIFALIAKLRISK